MEDLDFDATGNFALKNDNAKSCKIAKDKITM